MVEWGPHGTRKRTSASSWKAVPRWPSEDQERGGRAKVFCSELADVFDNKAPDGARDDLWELIRSTPQFDWLLLSKRPENMRRMLPADWNGGWPHVWLGVTAEDQAYFNRRWPILAATPAAVRFISYEPALGPLALGDAKPDWIICGGESAQPGHVPRWMEPAWARALRDECAGAGVAFFMKQMANLRPIPEDLMVREYPTPRFDGRAA